MTLKLRRTIGAGSFALALASVSWLLLGMFNWVPLVLQLPGESLLRTHATAAVACLMVAAWGFWDT